jgi:hypothetical protein
MIMEYKATFKSMLGLTVILLLLSIMSLYTGIEFNNDLMMAIGVIILLLLMIIRVRFKVSFDENQLQSTGFFSTKTLRFKEITGIVRMTDCGFPKNRFYGPHVYEFKGLCNSLKINFKLFPIECMNNIQKIIESGKNFNNK